MSRLITVLMPTRGPLQGLIQALNSIVKSCSDRSRVQILLKMDEDDQERTAIAKHLDREFNTQTIIGPRRTGYMSMGSFIDDLTPHATGQWCWLFDDDAWLTWDVTKPNWDDQLAKLEPSNRMANAEFYKLGESLYENNEFGGPPGLIIPTTLAKELRPTKSPVDQTWLDAGLARGWKINLLKGVYYCHEGRPR